MTWARDEREFVRRISHTLGTDSARLLGNDAAELTLEGRPVITVDSQIEGVHFPVGLDPARVARRLLAVNLSDLAACGADPTYALLALAAPRDFDYASFFASLGDACRHYGVTIAGGDLARAPQLTASLTLLGRLPDDGSMIRRDAGRAGDRVWVGGSLGESALGRHLLAMGASASSEAVDLGALPIPHPLRAAAEAAIVRHLAPRPQLDLGRWLGRQERVAALDISDGLALDLHRLLEASRVGAQLDAGALPIPQVVTEVAPLVGHAPLDLALAGGEDYVLLFSLPPDLSPPESFGAVPIGRLTAAGSIALRIDGVDHPLPPEGWDHLGRLGTETTAPDS
ncbi:MAG: thiamine-phosphate kinase [Thermoanaerobaculia bacterium]|nr:thiamine-phosphate kinase [Thermoanaerobaculia bacterium]